MSLLKFYTLCTSNACIAKESLLDAHAKDARLWWSTICPIMTFSYFIKVCSCLHFGQNERILHQNRVEKFFSNSFTQKSNSFWVISRHMCEDLEQSKQHHTCVCFAKTIKLSFPPLFLGESRAWKMRISDVWVGEKWSKWLVFRDIHSSFCSTRR